MTTKARARASVKMIEEQAIKASIEFHEYENIYFKIAFKHRDEEL